MSPPEVTAEWVLSQLDRALEAASGERVMVAFDADGTLWTGDVGLDLYDALLDGRLVRDAARDALAEEARAHGLSAEGDASAIARTLGDAYNTDRWPLARAFATMAWSFAGWHAHELDAFAREVATKAGLLGRFHAELAPIRAWARDHRVEMFVVSASPIAIVGYGAELLDIPRANVIAMTPAVSDAGVIEPRLAGPVVYGDGKIQAIRAARPDATILGAFGDSTYDAAMLRAARVPVAVAPSAGLRAILGEIPGVAVLPCVGPLSRGH